MSVYRVTEKLYPVYSGFRLRAPGIFFSALCLCVLLLPEAGASVNGFHQSKNEIDRFVEMLIVAETDDERAALLDGNSRLVTVELRKRLIEKGNETYEAGRIPAALIVFRLAQMVAERDGDQEGMAFAQFGLGYAYHAHGNPDRALRLYQNAAERFESVGNKAQQALVFKNMGALFLSQASYKQALEAYRKQLALFEETKDEAGIAGAYEDLASAHYEQEEYAVALEYFEKCLKLRERLGNRPVIAATLKAIGNALYHQQNYNRAIEYYKRALVLNEEMKDRRSAAAVLNSLGSSYYSQGEYDEALVEYQKSLGIEEEIGDRDGSATSLLGIGLVYYTRGDFARALEHFYRNLRILESLRNRTDLANTLQYIGQAHFNLQNHDAALDHYRKSLSIYEELKSSPETASVLVDIGSVYFALGVYDRTVEHYRKALALYEAVNYRPGIATILGAIADVHFTKRELDAALEGFQKSLSEFQLLGNKERIAATLNRIGGVYYGKGDTAQALEFAERAARLAREAGSLDILWQARFTAGAAYRTLEKRLEARKALEESVSIIETMRANITGSDFDRPGFSNGKTGPYLALVELCASEEMAVEAYNYAERIKALSLWDMLRSGRVRINKTMTAIEDEQERKLINAVVGLSIQARRERQRRSPDPARLGELSARLEKSRQEHDRFQRRLFSARPELKNYRAEMPAIAVDEAARLIRDRGTALLSFTVTDSQTFMFVMTTPEPVAARAARARRSPVDFRAYVLNIRFSDLSESIERFRRAIAGRSDEHHEIGAKLYELLLKPAEEQLAGKTTLVLAPDGVLWGLPFQALQSRPGRYVVEDHSLLYCHSLTALGAMAKETRGARTARQGSVELLGFANPTPSPELIDRIKLYNAGAMLRPMPETEDEVKGLGAVYGERASRIYVGSDAVEDRIKAESATSRVIHIAAPTMLGDSSPLYSTVLMSAPQENNSQDGAFQVWEIMQLNLRSEVAVFSACDHPPSRASNGVAALALSWAMYVAGCPASVVGSRGADFLVTTRLMTGFHRALRSYPRTTTSRGRSAAALRQAVLTLIKEKQFGHPYHWAGFIVIGTGY